MGLLDVFKKPAAIECLTDMEDFLDTRADARERISARIERAGLAAPRPVMDLPRETIKEFFDERPIHESLRGHDVILVHNNLRSNLCQMHDEFVSRADLPALARSVIAGPSPVTVPPVGCLAG